VIDTRFRKATKSESLSLPAQYRQALSLDSHALLFDQWTVRMRRRKIFVIGWRRHSVIAQVAAFKRRCPSRSIACLYLAGEGAAIDCSRFQAKRWQEECPRGVYIAGRSALDGRFALDE
jgi:hypothetical protein